MNNCKLCMVCMFELFEPFKGCQKSVEWNDGMEQ